MKFSSKTIDAPELYTLFFALIVLRTWYSGFKAGSSTLIAFVLIVSNIYPKYQKELIISYKPYRIISPLLPIESCRNMRQCPEASLFHQNRLVHLPLETAKQSQEIFFVLPYQSILFLAIICRSNLNTSSVVWLSKINPVSVVRIE